MTDQTQYQDSRLVPLYDLINRWGADDDFFLALANETPGCRLLDLGCGTGRLIRIPLNSCTVGKAPPVHPYRGITSGAAQEGAKKAKLGLCEPASFWNILACPTSSHWPTSLSRCNSRR
ncbi:hypothetical protein [Deinococcus wulumuqiensis]|uniref:hypothetical protein n=1 Tax=Deinococcus wulumuqiensis TaxID=980427 RepID=UPI0013C34ABB|nr:hypothetical protein [Deinococcus wulumuqiensis]